MSKFSVKKPLTVLVAVVIVLVLGFVSFTKMTPDLMPNMDMPYVMVMTTYAGATPEEVEQEVTQPIEKALGTLGNLVEITSTSSANYSMVTLEFTEDVNMDTISVDILQSINAISSQWNEMVGTPYILKINPSMIPVAVAAVNMEGMDAVQLSTFLDEELLYKLEGTAGVASVSANGMIEQQVSVVLNQSKIDALNKKVQQAISGQFADAEDQLSDAQTQLEAGQAQMELGKLQLEQGKEQLLNQTTQAESAISQLDELEAQLEQLEKTEQQLQSIYATVSKLEATQKELTNKVTLLETINAQLPALEAAEKEFQAELHAIDADTTLTEEEKTAKKNAILNSAEYKQNTAALATIDTHLAAMGTDRRGLEVELLTTQASLTTANASLGVIDAALTKLGVNRSDLANTLQEISSGKAQLSAAITQINNAIAQFGNGDITAEQALQELEKQKLNGMFQLSDASAQLILGEASLTSAAKEVEAGLTQLETAKEEALKQADLTNIVKMDTVAAILGAQNFSMPVGYVQEEGIDYLVSVGDKITTEEEMKNLVLLDLGMDDIGPIRVSDVADVFIANNANEVYATINGNDGILLTFNKQSTYATAEVSNNINAKFAELSEEYEGLTFTPLMDQGEYIYTIIESIFSSLIFGAIFAVIILFLFLRDIKPTFIILCSIPISVIFAFVMMYFSGITLNMISMSGLAVAVGMLVDNSVVVIENIYRLRNKGVSAIKSAIIGASQVAAAIASSTLTTVCVFLPIVFIEGMTRDLFTDMALTMGYALMASLIVALTVVPAMSSRMLKNTKEKKHRIFDKLMSVYQKTLRWALKYKAIVLIGSIVLLIGSGALAMAKGFVFMPETNATEINMTLEMPETAFLADTRKVADEAIRRISEIEGIETAGAMLSSSSGGMMGMLGGTGGSDPRNVTFYLTLEEGTDSKETTAKVLEAVSDLEGTFKTSGGGMASMMGGLSDSGITIRVYGEDLDVLQQTAKDIAAELETVDGTANISDGMEETDPAIQFIVDKQKAMEYGLTTAQVYQQLSAALQTEVTATTVNYSGDMYDVLILKDNKAELTPEFIKNYTFTVTMRDGTEETIAIQDIAEVIDTETLTSIKRVDQTRYIDVKCDVADDYNITHVAEAAKTALAEMELPEECRYEFSGGNEDIMASLGDLVGMLLLGVLLVYLIMVAQFQSLKHPFIVMFTIPLAFTGGLLGLLITGFEVSVMSMIGFVMLVGIIVNNGIVLIDYINQLRLAGMPKKEAIIEAGVTRMRPILMTTITTILGLLVMALGIGGGNELMQPIAIVCIGGLTYATLLTLYVIPIIYDIMNRKEMKRLNKQDLDIISEEALDAELEAIANKAKHFGSKNKDQNSAENAEPTKENEKDEMLM